MSTAAAASPMTHRMLSGPLVATLLRLATPNVIGLFATTLMIGYDGVILGRLGADALAGVALVLPLAMLMLQMSAGGMGGATTAAVARALGSGDREAADGLVRQALRVAVLGGLVFTAGVAAFGSLLFRSLGGAGGALEAAESYAGVLFAGAVVVWTANLLAGVVRGSGHMVLGSAALLVTAGVHVVLSPLLVFGWGDWPGLGVAGAAASTIVSNAASSLLLLGFLISGRGAVRLRLGAAARRPGLLQRILGVGLPASANPIISNVAIALCTGYMASFGTAAVAGYGIAARLEYILVPIAFGFGGALTAMVAANLGAGQRRRAWHVTWAGATIVLAVTGTIGVAAALWPAAWMSLFTSDAAIVEAGARYLRIVGGAYGFFGLGLALFFASQGMGRMRGPVLASTMRMAVVGVGGWLCLQADATAPAALHAVIAASFVVYAGAMALAVWRIAGRAEGQPSRQVTTSSSAARSVRKPFAG